MEQEQIIYDYIEGVLPPEKELELFQLLSSNEELRAELKNQMAIKNAVKSDVVAFTPKAQSTMNIFNTIGLTPPPGIAPIPGPGFFSVLASKLSGYTPFIMTGMATAVATAIVIFMLYDLGTFDDTLIAKYGKDGSGKEFVNSKIAVMTSEQENPIIDEITEIHNVNQIKAEPKTKIVYKYVYLTGDGTIGNTQASSTQVTENESIVDDSNTDKLIMPAQLVLNNENLSDFINFRKSYQSPLLMGNPFGSNEINNPMLESDIFKVQEMENFSVEIRGSIYQYGEDIRIDPAKSDLSNLGISVLYSLFDELKVGFDYHRENFYQTFSGMEDGVLYTYKQNPNISTYGIVVRYHPDVLKFSYFTPFAQLNGGLSQIGPIGRIMAGFEFSSTDNYKIILGYDYNYLRFKHSGNWFNSDKTGVQIGFGLKF